MCNQTPHEAQLLRGFCEGEVKGSSDTAQRFLMTRGCSCFGSWSGVFPNENELGECWENASLAPLVTEPAASRLSMFSASN